MSGLIEVGPLVIDVPARLARLDGELIEELTRIEFELLAFLAVDPDRCFTKDELLRSVWGWRGGSRTTRTLDSHACRLRKKLGGDWVQNVWGVGYRLTNPYAAAVIA